jgi:hypothetical protein
MLTEEQQRFLLRYINNKGDFYKTVDSLGLDLSHITSWQQSNIEFEQSFRRAKQAIIDHLKQENYITALLRVNDALMNGVTQTSVVQKHRVGATDEDGNQSSEFEVIRTTKNLGIPGWCVTEALKESSIEKAVHVLASEGVLPTSVARKILQSANRITADVKDAFDISKDNEYVNDAKVISLIRAAVLGGVEI